jgi:diguanylate cyclase (GGDEF)-like protein
MQTQTKEVIATEIGPVLFGPAWEPHLPVMGDIAAIGGLTEARHALRHAECIIREQEERIRALEALTLTDELTGVANRRGFNNAFHRELSLARRDEGRSGVVVMIDLDGFKQINDTYGHQAGDAYLRAVAQALAEFVRSSDLVARLGGDEFALLLTDIDEKDGARRLARLEQMFNSRSMLWEGRRLVLRASFGMAPYTGGDSVETVTEAADIRLYAHKARNRQLSAAR